MTYEEAYRSCKTQEEFQDMIVTDLYIAAFINKDREKVIRDAAQKVADERNWLFNTKLTVKED